MDFFSSKLYDWKIDSKSNIYVQLGELLIRKSSAFETWGDRRTMDHGRPGVCHHDSSGMRGKLCSDQPGQP